MKLPIIVLIFLILVVAKSSAKPPILNPRNNVVITESLIRTICRNPTTNSTLCISTLDRFKGKPLFPESVSNVTGMVHNMVKTTSKQIRELYDGVKDDSSELKLIYRNCLHIYNGVAANLTEARRFSQASNKRSVKQNASLAIQALKSCGRELKKLGHVVPSDVVRANKRVQEFCSIIKLVSDH